MHMILYTYNNQKIKKGYSFRILINYTVAFFISIYILKKYYITYRKKNWSWTIEPYLVRRLNISMKLQKVWDKHQNNKSYLLRNTGCFMTTVK